MCFQVFINNEIKLGENKANSKNLQYVVYKFDAGLKLHLHFEYLDFANLSPQKKQKKIRLVHMRDTTVKPLTTNDELITGGHERLSIVGRNFWRCQRNRIKDTINIIEN